MTHELTFEQIQRSKKIFDSFKSKTNKDVNINDEEKEETLEVSKLVIVLTNLGFEIGQDEVEEIKTNMKLNSSIDFSTFLRITAIKFKQQELIKELENAFKAFDKHNNGYLTHKELKSIITENGPNLTIEEANDLLKEIGLLDEVIDKNFYYSAFVADTI